ncbi:MAG: hypothetical protein LBV51_02770 [Acholeplasmatales bacterium]|jgi:hypothetical protein|nr:hypothetical protein [Acholeplasmatales bacterium]
MKKKEEVVLTKEELDLEIAFINSDESELGVPAFVTNIVVGEKKNVLGK